MTIRHAMCSALICTLLVACGDTDAPGDGPAPDASAAMDVTADAAMGGDVTAPDVTPPGDEDVPPSGGEDIAEGPTPLTEDEHLEVWDLGSVTIDPATGASEKLAFHTPPDAVSVAITVDGAPGVYYAVEDLVAPDGVTLVPGAWYTSPNNPGGHQVCVHCENRVSSSSGAHATLVPITPSVPVLEGDYLFRIVAFDVVIESPWSPPEFEMQGGEVQVSAIIKRAPGGLPETGRLDLNLHFTGAGGLTAETAPTDTRMVEALALFEELYAQIGVSVGQVTWRDIDPAFSFIDGIMGPDTDFEAAAAETAGAPPGVNFIFVDEIVDSGNPLGAFGVILGVSGGIPGPVGVQGSPRSAVIVDISVPELAGDVPFGFTMAHEMGHFLGLFHSSEMPFANLHDPLPDTAENDTTNLMFFEASGGGSTLTTDQGRVIRGNPWVRHEQGDTP